MTVTPSGVGYHRGSCRVWGDHVGARLDPVDLYIYVISHVGPVHPCIRIDGWSQTRLSISPPLLRHGEWAQHGEADTWGLAGSRRTGASPG
jgi:hypothetical protein